MKRHISFPSIGSFRNIVAEIKARSTYIGRDENGDAIFDESLPMPTLTFNGTVKLHGVNCGVNYNKNIGIWPQSREILLDTSSDGDLNGFAKFVDAKENSFLSLFSQIKNVNIIDDNLDITIFGEYAGIGIQKGVGISLLDKSFFIFGVKVSSNDPDIESYWLDYTQLRDTENKIYNINDYKSYSITIDFNNPSEQIDKLNELVIEVEKNCPVANEFGINGIGEGIVFTTTWEGKNYRFKAKGEKHSVVKTKKIVDVDVEKLSSISEFINYAVTENRLDQAIQFVFRDSDPIIGKMGEVMKWINLDIIKEESDTLKANNLEFKEINKSISSKVREMFIQKLNSLNEVESR